MLQIIKAIAHENLNHWSAALFLLIWPIARPIHHFTVKLLQAICDRLAPKKYEYTLLGDITAVTLVPCAG